MLRVDMGDLTAKLEDLPEKYRNLGGRAMTSTMVADEVPADCHPLGPNNKLVISPGMVTGTNAPTSGRLSMGGKSPLTGGIKESNAGTDFSQRLANLRIRAIVVQGQPEDGKYRMLKVNKDGAELVDASKYVDRGLYDVYKEIRKEHGEVSICATGIAGEMRAASAGVAFNDIEGLSSRYAGRGGLGSVMAVRGLKAIVLDDNGAPGREIKDQEQFKQGIKKMRDALTSHDVTKPGGTLSSYGTDALVNVINEAGALPQNNFRKGYDERAANVSGEKKAEVIKKRGGERPHRCSPGCIIQCSEVWVKEDGSDPVGVLEYESVWALGPNSGIYDLDAVGELNRACNDLGLDTIEMGDTFAVAMDGGLAEFGDSEAALQWMEEIRNRTPLGRILANGTEFTGKAFGINRIPTTKGQGMPAYDPRPIKGIGVTYATTPMGADHTAGYSIAPEIMGVGGKKDPLDTSKGELSKALQTTTALIDTSGYCLFTAFAMMDIPEGMEGLVESCNGVLGTNWSVDDAMDLGARVLQVERDFNRRAGFTNLDDRLPEFMEIEALPPGGQTADVSDEEMDRVFGE
ncbi:MAG: aldehyde ferredoxin oxidoreductase C-terminal domain-containing protein [Methanomassiliicoccales archaeon]